MITIDLDRMEPMAALPFHPSEAVTLEFDVLEEQDGSMVFTGDEVVVDLTGYIQ